jgi:hypothetical protein
MNQTTHQYTVPDVLGVDRGPVRDAALILANYSTLASHVIVLDGDHVTRIEMDKTIPFEMWGSGTQSLWRLLCAIAYSRHEVSLYEVASRLDTNNQVAARHAIGALFGGAR